MFYSIKNYDNIHFTYIEQIPSQVGKDKALDALSTLFHGLWSGYAFEKKDSKVIELSEIRDIATTIFTGYTDKYQKNRGYICRSIDYVRETLGMETQRSKIKKVYDLIMGFNGEVKQKIIFSVFHPDEEIVVAMRTMFDRVFQLNVELLHQIDELRLRIENNNRFSNIFSWKVPMKNSKEKYQLKNVLLILIMKLLVTAFLYQRIMIAQERIP